MERPVTKPPKPLQFKASLEPAKVRSAEIIRVEGLVKVYNGKIILRDVTFTLKPNARVVITGPNGSGKTTLLRLLTSRENPDYGEVKLAPGIRLGYLPQEPEAADRTLTMLDYYSLGLSGSREDYIFGLVTCGLFSYDEINKTLDQLSLGQVRKLEIARLVAAEPDVLILDEPTNHISLDVLESFEVAVTSFKGPVLAVSHDRHFVRQFGGEIWDLRDGNIFLSGQV